MDQYFVNSGKVSHKVERKFKVNYISTEREIWFLFCSWCVLYNSETNKFSITQHQRWQSVQLYLCNNMFLCYCTCYLSSLLIIAIVECRIRTLSNNEKFNRKNNKHWCSIFRQLNKTITFYCCYTLLCFWKIRLLLPVVDWMDRKKQFHFTAKCNL